MVRKGWKNAAILTAMSLMLLPTFQAYAVTARQNTKGNFVQEEGNWRFKTAEGSKVEGWVVSNNEWYYLDPTTGNLRSGWLRLSDGQTYFLYTIHDGNFGKAVNGWNWIDGYCYYFETADNGQNGILKTNGRTADGYLVDAAGRWVNESTGQAVYEAGKGLPSSESDQQVAGADRPIPQVAGVSRASGASASSGSSRSAGRGGSSASGSGSGSIGSRGGSSTGSENNTANSGSTNAGNATNNGSANTENNTNNDSNTNTNQDSNKPETKTAVNAEKTKAVHTELGDFVSVVFNEGSISDYDVYVDGVDVTAALTKVDDEGKIVKWISTVASPKTLEVKKKGTEETVQTITLNKGTATEAVEAGNPEDAPKYLLTRGRVSIYDYYLGPKDKEGKEKLYPSTTTFDLTESRKENSKNVSTQYYVKPVAIDEQGRGVNGQQLVAKFSLSGEEQTKWFEGIDKIALLRYDDNTLINGNLTHSDSTEKSKYGTNGVITIPTNQGNMRNHGLYLLNIHSSYTEESVTIPVEFVKAAKFSLKLQAQSNNAKQGERVGFDVVGENGATFGNDLKVDNMQVTLIKPDGSSHNLTYINDFFNFINYFIVYGTGGEDGKTVNTDQVGTYTLKVRYAGYQEMETKFEIFPGKAVNTEDSDTEKAARSAARKKSSGSSSSGTGKKVDSVSAATAGSIGKKKNSKKKASEVDSTSSATGGGSTHYDARVIFNYDLLSNALLLNELGMLNSDAENVVEQYFNMTIDDSSYLYNEGADAFYSYRDYLNANAEKRRAGGKLLSFKDFIATAQKKDYNGPSQVLNVLEDGRLGALSDFKLVKGEKTPAFIGTTTEVGGEFSLKTEDKEYLKAITRITVDGQSANLLDSYNKPVEIKPEEGSILVHRSAFNFYNTPELSTHTLRISAGSKYRDVELKLQFKEKADNLQFNVEGEAFTEKDVVLSLGTSEEAKNALKNFAGIQLKKPNSSELRTLLDAMAGGKSGNDYYVLDKEKGTITLKAGLFKEAGEYQFFVKLTNRTKSLSGKIDVKENVDTPTNPDENANTEGHPETASFEAVNEKDKDKSYRTLSFTGLERAKLHAYLQNIEAIRVNGEDYTEAFSSIRIGENEYFAVASNGDGFKNTLRLDKTSLVEGENKVIIELKDKTKKTFKVNLASEKKNNNSSNTENNNSSLKAKEVSKIKSLYGNVESYAVLFEGDSKEVQASLDQIESVSLNGNALDKASAFAGGFGNFPENSYAVKNIVGAYGATPSLQLSASSVQEGTNRLLVKFTDGKTLSLNFDHNGKIVEEVATVEGKEIGIASIKKTKSFLFGSKLEVKFKDMDQKAMAAFEKTVQSVSLNGKSLNKEIHSGSKEGSYHFALITDAYSGVDHLILSSEDAKEKVNTLVIDAEGYKSLTVKFDQDGKILEDEGEEAAKDNHLEVVEKRESRNGVKYFALSFPEMSEEEAAAYLAKLSNVTVNGVKYALSKTSPYKLFDKQYFADKKGTDSTLNAALSLTQAGGVKIGENELVLETKDGESQSYLFTVEALDAPAFKEATQKNTGEVEIFFTGKAADINAYLKRDQITVTVNGKKLELQGYYTNLKYSPAIGVIEAAYFGRANQFYIGKDALQAGENTVTISSPDYKEQSFSFTYEK
ncbi:hemoblobin-interacting domain-containing protein [Oribacterium sp.]